MHCLRKLIATFILLGTCAGAGAGVETPLLLEIQGECTVRVVHDAIPDSSTGTLLFRSFRLIEGLSNPCDLTASQVAASLGRGIAAYLAQDNLKPATSLFVGRISRYPWVRSAWQQASLTGSYEKLGIDDFNALVGAGNIARPFTDALRVNGLEPGGASCEKLQFFGNGAPMDGLCWFLIEEH